MSRKDYIKFAEIFKVALSDNDTDLSIVLDKLVYEVAKVFHYDNPAFRPYQFFQACGYSKVQAGHMEARI